MCGIAGLFGCAEAHIAGAMAALLSHRGPDGQGFWSDDVLGANGAVIAFGHARLAIVDIVGSDQPIGSDHGCTLIANGEIYGHRRVRRDEPGYPWRTAGDSEAILAAHAAAITSPAVTPRRDEGSQVGSIRMALGQMKDGGEAKKHLDWINRLNGIWGFALWDPRWRELILCRDPLGVKPLNRYQTENGTLMFSSESKAFRAHPEFTPKLDIDALVQRLVFEYPIDQTTLFQDVIQVAPGTVETWSLDLSGAAVLTGVARYSSDRVEPALQWNVESGADALLDGLRHDLADRLMSDVPVGIVLSGGLDSSLIAALANEAADIAGQAVPACWTVTESEDNPDHLAAREVTAALDLEHHAWTLEEEAFHQRLPDLSWHGEDLDVTVLFFQPLFERMASKVTVGLCGQGADELHAGYPRYRDLAGHSALVRARLNSLDSKILNGTNRHIGPGQPWSSSLPKPELVFENLTDTLQFELDRGQLSNFQLRLVDRHSMAHGLEVRVPFLGHRHRSIANSLPLSERLQPGVEKVALRRAAAKTDLPKHIIDRPKLPAGTATSPRMIDEMLEELRPHSIDWLAEMGPLQPLLKGQPDLIIGLRLFQAIHLSPGSKRRTGSLLDLLDDVVPIEVES